MRSGAGFLLLLLHFEIVFIQIEYRSFFYVELVMKFVPLFFCILACWVCAEEDPMQKVPEYTRDIWLRGSVSETDLVVRGTPHAIPGIAQDGHSQTTGQLAVQETLFGTVDPAWRDNKGNLILIEPFRCTWEREGIWILLKTTKGYFVINPDFTPLTGTEWPKINDRLKVKPAPPAILKAHVSETSIYHTYMLHENETWHGTNVFRYADNVCSEVFVKGERVGCRSWDSAGRLCAIFVSGLGESLDRGFSLDFHLGKVRSFAHFKNGKKEGLSCIYTTNEAQLREESQWHAGLRHGRTRIWDHAGILESDLVYEDGLITPIIHHVGAQQPQAEVFRSEFGVDYSAPREIVDQLLVGMNTNDVSNLIRTDFSERSGLTFNFYGFETRLQIVFKDGKISERKETWNGTCHTLRK